MWLDLIQQARFIHGSDNRFTRGKALHTLKRRRDFIGAGGARFTVGVKHLGTAADIAVKGQDVDHRQLVTTTHFIVVEIVRRGDLHAAGAFFHIGVLITHDRNATIYQRQDQLFADQIFIAWIFRIDGNAGIAQQGFRAGGSDNQIIFAVCRGRAIRQRIADMPHRAFAFAVFYFQIGDSGAQFRVPVYQAFATVDQVLFIKAHKNFFHRI